VSGLYRDFGPVVHRRCLRLLRDRNVEKLQDRETVLPWIHRVATNHCLNLRRHALRRGEESAAEDDRALPPSSRGRSPDAIVDWNLARSVLAGFDGETQAVAVGCSSTG
jgi:RNA polymerase sigma-70 factor (ECF subfamily)